METEHKLGWQQWSKNNLLRTKDDYNTQAIWQKCNTPRYRTDGTMEDACREFCRSYHPGDVDAKAEAG